MRVNTEWGELFVEKYANAEAAKSFQEALKVDPEYGPALLGMARALADENPPQAVAFAQRALKVNPNDAGAHLLMARDGRLPGQEGRREGIDRARA